MEAANTNILKECRSLVNLFFLILKDRPNILFSFNPKTNLHALMVCWLLRIRCVPNVSGSGEASQLKGPLGKIYRYLAGFFYLQAAHVFFQNEDDCHAFVKLGWVRSHQAEVLPGSGVNLSEFQPHKKEDTTFRFLMASRLISSKGVVEYLEAARSVLESGCRCEFLLAGVKDLSSRAISPKLLADIDQVAGITFVGHVKDMPALLKTVDCVVLPSYYPEGVPRSLIEAASSGKIIITTDTPGCRDVVEEGHNGYLVKAQSSSQLVEAIRKVLTLTGEQRESMQLASRKLAEERFDEGIVIRRYLDVAEEINRKN